MNFKLKMDKGSIVIVGKYYNFITERKMGIYSYSTNTKSSSKFSLTLSIPRDDYNAFNNEVEFELDSSNPDLNFSLLQPQIVYDDSKNNETNSGINYLRLLHLFKENDFIKLREHEDGLEIVFPLLNDTLRIFHWFLNLYCEYFEIISSDKENILLSKDYEDIYDLLKDYMDLDYGPMKLSFGTIELIDKYNLKLFYNYNLNSIQNIYPLTSLLTGLYLMTQETIKEVIFLKQDDIAKILHGEGIGYRFKGVGSFNLLLPSDFRDYFPIDSYIFDSLYMMNKLGLKPFYSCSGHDLEKIAYEFYVSFTTDCPEEKAKKILEQIKLINKEGNYGFFITKDTLYDEKKNEYLEGYSIRVSPDGVKDMFNERVKVTDIPKLLCDKLYKLITKVLKTV